MKVDLDKYETVKERKKRFYKDYPNGSIIVEILNKDILEHALFKSTIYRNPEEQEKNIIFAVGYAHEIRDKELKVSKYGEKYKSVNFTSWIENCEESSIGRALDNAGYSGNDKCSREEMGKVVNSKLNQNNGNKIGVTTKEQKRLKLVDLIKQKITNEQAKDHLKRVYQKEKTSDLTEKEIEEFINFLNK